MNTQKAIHVIDVISNSNIDTQFIDQIIYGKFEHELYKHILDKWESNKGDFFSSYLSTKDEVKRLILESLGIEVEPDKYPDYEKRVMAQLLKNMKVFETYPFEISILYQYCLFCYNNSLQVLKVISPSAWQSISENKIDLFGNYNNWTKFWSVASQEDKEKLLNKIVETK